MVAWHPRPIFNANNGNQYWDKNIELFFYAKRPSVQEKCRVSLLKKVVHFIKDEKKVCITEESSPSLFDEVILWAVKWQNQVCVNTWTNNRCHQRREYSEEPALKKPLERIDIWLVSFMYQWKTNHISWDHKEHVNANKSTWPYGKFGVRQNDKQDGKCTQKLNFGLNFGDMFCASSQGNPI